MSNFIYPVTMITNEWKCFSHYAKDFPDKKIPVGVLPLNIYGDICVWPIEIELVLGEKITFNFEQKRWVGKTRRKKEGEESRSKNFMWDFVSRGREFNTFSAKEIEKNDSFEIGMTISSTKTKLSCVCLMKTENELIFEGWDNTRDTILRSEYLRQNDSGYIPISTFVYPEEKMFIDAAGVTNREVLLAGINFLKNKERA